jgi:hypothetical protein
MAIDVLAHFNSRVSRNSEGTFTRVTIAIGIYMYISDHKNNKKARICQGWQSSWNYFSNRIGVPVIVRHSKKLINVSHDAYMIQFDSQ